VVEKKREEGWSVLDVQGKLHTGFGVECMGTNPPFDDACPPVTEPRSDADKVWWLAFRPESSRPAFGLTPHGAVAIVAGAEGIAVVEVVMPGHTPAQHMLAALAEGQKEADRIAKQAMGLTTAGARTLLSGVATGISDCLARALAQVEVEQEFSRLQCAALGAVDVFMKALDEMTKAREAAVVFEEGDVTSFVLTQKGVGTLKREAERVAAAREAWTKARAAVIAEYERHHELFKEWESANLPRMLAEGMLAEAEAARGKD
jgi:hypothetical protein